MENIIVPLVDKADSNPTTIIIKEETKNGQRETQVHGIASGKTEGPTELIKEDNVVFELLVDEKIKLINDIKDLKSKLAKAQSGKEKTTGNRVRPTYQTKKKCPICLCHPGDDNPHHFNKIGMVETDSCFLSRNLEIIERLKLYKIIGLCFRCGLHRRNPKQKCKESIHPSGKCKICENRWWTCWNHRNENWDLLANRDFYVKQFLK